MRPQPDILTFSGTGHTRSRSCSSKSQLPLSVSRPVAYRGVVRAGEGSQWTIETLAVLFTDIEGSTAMASRLSPEEADETRRSHFSILRQAVAEWGGTEVKNLGDGLMVVFQSASVAMACAVAMQQGVEQDNRRSLETVGLRVGLSGGEVSKEDGDYFGDPVIEAARLCALCDSGQILATDMVRLTSGRRNRHECTPKGYLSLKGLPDPVETIEVDPRVAWENWPITGSAPPGLKTWTRRLTTPAEPPRPPWPHWRPVTPCITTPKRSRSLPKSTSPTQSSGLT
jgi:class 3 adenylate cyclase